MNKNTLNPPLSPLPGGLFISSLFEGVLLGGGGGVRVVGEGTPCKGVCLL